MANESKEEREKRLAQALRANLRRRKGQAVAREEPREAPTQPSVDESDLTGKS